MLFRWFIILALTFLSVIGISPTIDYYSNYFGNDSLSAEELYKSNDLKDKSFNINEFSKFKNKITYIYLDKEPPGLVSIKVKNISISIQESLSQWVYTENL